jgi:hypothetical protein
MKEKEKEKKKIVKELSFSYSLTKKQGVPKTP